MDDADVTLVNDSTHLIKWSSSLQISQIQFISKALTNTEIECTRC